MIRREVRDLVNLQLQDNVQAVWINAELSNTPVTNDESPLRSQEAIYHHLKNKIINQQPAIKPSGL